MAEQQQQEQLEEQEQKDLAGPPTKARYENE
jgi:hypothetical protein